MEQPDAAPPIPDDLPPAAFDPGAALDIDRYELDGIPLFHMPMAGSTILSLSFRVGRADEPIVRGGMTHLAEHLILTAIDDALDHSNGSTEPFRVTFVVRGTPDRAARFLRDVCAAIEQPRFGRMYEEAKVLRTEAQGRPSGMGLSLRTLWYRIGFQGLGAVHLPEFFLDALDESVLRTWMAEHLVAGNAAIWIAGELPADLYVALPPGPRKPPPDVREIDGFQTPTYVVEDAPGVGASFSVDRNLATATGFRTIERELVRRLRVDRGLGYEVGTDAVPIGDHRSFMTLWATCLPEATRDVQQAIFEVIDDVAARGPTDDDLHRFYEEAARAYADPMAVPARLDAHVANVLLGTDPEPRPVATRLDEQWRLQSADVASAIRTARESMLVLLPTTGVDPQRPFKPYPGPATDAVGADRTFELVTKDAGWLRKSKAPRLAVGAAGIAIDGSNGRRLSAVRWSDCVAVIRERDVRSVLGRDGTVLQILAADWRDGRTAIGLVDRHAPSGVTVPVGT